MIVSAIVGLNALSEVQLEGPGLVPGSLPAAAVGGLIVRAAAALGVCRVGPGHLYFLNFIN